MAQKIIISSDEYSPRRTTEIILNGTIIALVFVGSLIIIADILQSSWRESDTWIYCAVLIYLFWTKLILSNGRKQTANWMLVIFFLVLAAYSLLSWGLGTPIGILAVGFAILLPALLMGSGYILPVAVVSLLLLISVQFVHAVEILTPSSRQPLFLSSEWDIIPYATILVIFALVSWLAGSQREKNLRRVLVAEARLLEQKEALKIELKKESEALQEAQFNQIRQLHGFALLGQSSAAILHDLSNHLSILNLDIDDLKQQHKNSKAIESAENAMLHVNEMVRHARQQLNAHDTHETFNAMHVVNHGLKDVRGTFAQHRVTLKRRQIGSKKPFLINGSRFALMQVISILLNNALDAVKEKDNPKVTIEIKNTSSDLHISIIDNGTGINPDIAPLLFQPLTSTKTSGLGVGLYIAHSLLEEQFKGKIRLHSNKDGAHFIVTIPRQSQRLPVNT